MAADQIWQHFSTAIAVTKRDADINMSENYVKMLSVLSRYAAKGTRESAYISVCLSLQDQFALQL